jgi:hypothetical protein
MTLSGTLVDMPAAKDSAAGAVLPILRVIAVILNQRSVD